MDRQGYWLKGFGRFEDRNSAGSNLPGVFYAKAAPLKRRNRQIVKASMQVRNNAPIWDKACCMCKGSCIHLLLSFHCF